MQQSPGGLRGKRGFPCCPLPLPQGLSQEGRRENVKSRQHLWYLMWQRQGRARTSLACGPDQPQPSAHSPSCPWNESQVLAFATDGPERQVTGTGRMKLWVWGLTWPSPSSPEKAPRTPCCPESHLLCYLASDTSETHSLKPSLVEPTGQGRLELTREWKPRPPPRRRSPGCEGDGAKPPPREDSGGGSARREAALGQRCRVPGSDVPFRGFREAQVRTMWGELDESDGSQLFAEFLKDYHALEEGLVVQPEGDSMAGVTAGRCGERASVVSQCL